MSYADDPRAALNPLFNANKLKLGVFFLNIGGGPRPTTAEGKLQLTWPSVTAVARLADAAGMEALVPLCSWKGRGGPSKLTDESYEVWTWAAGLAQATSHISVLSTAQTQVYHPVMMAKMATTLDHISGGRFGINVVNGSRRDNLNLFGLPEIEHDALYDLATEWLEIAERLWTSEQPFDYPGQYFQLADAISEPRPLQQPRPAIMNAGVSPVGQRWAAQHADILFTAIRTGWSSGAITQSGPAGGLDDARRQVGAARALAHEFGRQIQVWVTSSVVVRPTQQEADDYVDYFAVEHGDFAAAGMLQAQAQVVAELDSLPPEVARQKKRELVAGSFFMQPLVGTPESITERLLGLSDAGIDGVLLTFVNYHDELTRWNRDVMPLLEQAGLRQPFAGAAGRGSAQATAHATA